MFTNTRHSTRTLPSEFAFIQIFGDDGGRILNISDAGLCFEAFAPLGTAKTLQFWFSLNLRDRVEAVGEVVWLDSGTKIGGLRFVNPTDLVMEHIRCYTAKPGPSSAKWGQHFVEALAKQRPEAVSAKTTGSDLQEPPSRRSHVAFRSPALLGTPD